jgi:steroid delta-isomerase-like uncharacterized protein
MKNLLMAIPLVCLLCFVVGCQDKAAMAELEKFKAQAAVEEQNKALIVRYFQEVDKGDVEAVNALIDEMYAPDYVGYFALSEQHGPEALKEHYSNALLTFGDMHHTVEDMIAGGHMVAVRCTFQATHKGDFMGVPATGKLLKGPVFYIFYFEDGKVKEARLDWDSLLGLTMQLGMELKPKEVKK